MVLTRRVAVSGAKRVDRMLVWFESVTPEATNVVGQQVERERRPGAPADYLMDVPLRREEFIEVTGTKVASLHLLQVGSSFSILTIDSPVHKLVLFAPIQAHQPPGEMVMDGSPRSRREHQTEEGQVTTGGAIDEVIADRLAHAAGRIRDLEFRRQPAIVREEPSKGFAQVGHGPSRLRGGRNDSLDFVDEAAHDGIFDKIRTVRRHRGPPQKGTLKQARKLPATRHNDRRASRRPLRAAWSDRVRRHGPGLPGV